MVTKQELEQYRSIVAKMGEVRDRLNNNTVSDTVVGSDAEFPYTAHTISVGGVTESSRTQRDMMLLRTLEVQKQNIEDFVNGIADSQIRRIIRCRYIDGTVRPSWKWIAFKMGVSGDGSTERKIVDRFLKVSPNSRK